MDGKLIIHATSLSLKVGTYWRGVLIMGPSGIGKSDLALRVLQAGEAAGCALISDDYSCLWPSGGALYAAAPATIEGRMEIRGLGITDEPARRQTRIDLAVLAQSDPVERLPEGEMTSLLGHAIPTIRLRPQEASSVSKLLTKLRQTPR